MSGAGAKRTRTELKEHGRHVYGKVEAGARAPALLSLRVHMYSACTYSFVLTTYLCTRTARNFVTLKAFDGRRAGKLSFTYGRGYSLPRQKAREVAQEVKETIKVISQ